MKRFDNSFRSKIFEYARIKYKTKPVHLIMLCCGIATMQNGTGLS